MTGGINGALNAARTGLQVTERSLQVKTTNIAGQGAIAYKKESHLITDLPSIDMGGLATPTSTNNTFNPTGLQLGLGVQSAGIQTDFSQGDPTNTGQYLDVMIEGPGFFEVTLPDGTTAYTRVGTFQTSSTNEIVMPKTGYVLAPGITLPQTTTSVLINDQGQVYVTVAGSETPQQVGQISIATFYNPSGLKKVGDSMYMQSAASGEANSVIPGVSGSGVLKQGWREGSNVNAVEEMTDLIQLEKIYDMLTKLVKTADQMMSSITQINR